MMNGTQLSTWGGLGMRLLWDGPFWGALGWLGQGQLAGLEKTFSTLSEMAAAN
jgi:hypothetical protein